MKKKKVLALVLAVVMVTASLVGCGDKKDPDKGKDVVKPDVEVETPDDETKDPEPPVSDIDTTEEVTLQMYFHGSNVTDDSAVLEEVNKYLKDKINVVLKPIWGSWGDFDEGATVALQAGDKSIDIYFTCSWSANEYNKYSADGYYVKLDDMIPTYAPDIWAALPEVLKEGAKINGKDGLGVYAIPGYKDLATQNCWDVNVTLLEKYGYTLNDIKSTDYYGFGDILATVKAGEGKSFYPLCIEPAVLERMVTNSIIVTGDGDPNILSLYINPDDISKDGAYGNTVLNKFATDEYKKFVEKTREYYLAGYIDPAMTNKETANDARTNALLTAQYLIATQSYSLGYEVTASRDRGIEVAFVPCTEPYTDTTSSQGAMYAISTASQNPERALMFLNLLNTDPYLMNLLVYGVEGVHYTMEDGEVKLDDEQRANYSPWLNGIGNSTILKPLKGQGVDFYKEFVEYYANAKEIPSLGWGFISTNVKEEMGAVCGVAAQYNLALASGAVDPATELPKLLKALDDNGMQKILDEANVQLKAFMDTKK